MRFSSLFGPTAAEIVSIILISCVHTSQGVNFAPVPSPNLDLSQLGRVAFAGNFDAISLFTYENQNENSFSTNGSQSLLSQMPNGEFATLASADASIVTMCPFVMKDGTMAGIVVGGNFTSLGGVAVQGVALFNSSSGEITQLTGLSGHVSAVLCDQDFNTVFVGGDFTGGNSTNAVAWVGMTGWTNLPFSGFNGPVTSIAKDVNGSIIFGGSFSGLGNATTPTIKDSQVINLSSAKISSSSTVSTAGFIDPMNLVCSSGQSGVGQTWLLEDNTAGWWKAEMNFGYEPTKVRIWNTNQDGRGTKTFRFTAFPINGIMNLTYTDPATNQDVACQSQCSLSQNTSYQDFYFVNVIGMSGFQIDISDWYGPGGGLDGVELFQDQIYAYAVSSLDEPACSVPTLGSNATTTGQWTVMPSGQSNSEYLSINLTGPGVNAESASVTFLPEIGQSGNYTVMIYTPGCQQDNTCGARGIINVTGTFASGVRATSPLQTNIYQTNDFDKYDQLYHGYVDAGTDEFRPSITIQPLATQNNSINVVAHRVRFVLDASTGGLNGLFEWNPNQATVAQTDYSTSVYDSAGMGLNTNALIITLDVIGNTTYVAGNFSGNEFENIFAVANGKVTSLPDRGLNAAVETSHVYGDLLFLGGNFTNTVNPATPGMSNVAAFDTSSQNWQALGSGVNGQVLSIVPMEFNITSGQPETCITVNGEFDQVLGFSQYSSFTVTDGLAIWVPSHNNWLQNLNVQTMAVTGQLSAATNISGSSPLLAGTVSNQGTSISDATELTTSGALSINSLGLQIQPQKGSSSSFSKRAVTGQNITGAVVGLFDTDNGRNTTILGGHFTATTANGSTINNLVFVNSTSNGPQSVAGIGSGIDSDSMFLALATQGDTLYAGGIVTGTVNSASINGLVLWDLAQSNFVSPQPPALGGSNVTVNAITVQPSTSNVYVAGTFDQAGSLLCPSICLFMNGQWSRPGTGLSGNISALAWQGTTQLLAAGSLVVAGNATSLATYDTTTQQWLGVGGASALPGPVNALAAANSDTSNYWVAGKSTNGSAFLMKYDGSSFHAAGDVLGSQSVIHGLSLLSLSQDHTQTTLVDSGLSLLVTGQLNIPDFGNASAALFNGTTFTPFLLSNSGNNPGSISQVFTENQQTFSTSSGTLKVGFVILIALACAAGCIFLIVLAGLIMENRRRRKEGYRPAPQNYYEKTANMSRIPPERLFGNLGRRPAGPQI